MFKSRAVAKVKPSNSFKTALILGIGNCFQKIIYKMYSFIFFAVMKVGDAHSNAD